MDHHTGAVIAEVGFLLVDGRRLAL